MFYYISRNFIFSNMDYKIYYSPFLFMFSVVTVYRKIDITQDIDKELFDKRRK